MLLRLLEKWNPTDRLALERYYRDEHLSADLDLHRARERAEMNNLERALYAARSYFAA